MPGEDLDKLIAPFTMKGLSGQAVSGEFSHYLADPGEWGERNGTQEQYEWEYAKWHQDYHKNRHDSRCRICAAEQKFYEQKRPHDEYHKARRQYDPSCRFCQDDRFFGRI